MQWLRVRVAERLVRLLPFDFKLSPTFLLCSHDSGVTAPREAEHCVAALAHDRAKLEKVTVCHVCFQDWWPIFWVLGALDHLVDLSIVASGLQTSDGIMLAQCLSRMHLHTLGLNGNPLGDQGVFVVLRALRGQTLTCLDVADTQMSSDNTRTLALAVADIECIDKLVIDFEYAGWAEDFVPAFTTIRQLALHGSPVNEADVTTLADCYRYTRLRKSYGFGNSVEGHEWLLVDAEQQREARDRAAECMFVLSLCARRTTTRLPSSLLRYVWNEFIFE